MPRLYRMPNAMGSMSTYTGTEVSQSTRQWGVREMLADWLRTHGYDGLYWQSGGDTCGCPIERLAPCEDGPTWQCGECPGCVPGYWHSDGLMYPERESDMTRIILIKACSPCPFCQRMEDGWYCRHPDHVDRIGDDDVILETATVDSQVDPDCPLPKEQCL